MNDLIQSIALLILGGGFVLQQLIIRRLIRDVERLQYQQSTIPVRGVWVDNPFTSRMNVPSCSLGEREIGKELGK